MNERSISYKGLTIISHPQWYPDQHAFGATGKIKGIQLGDGGSKNLLFSSATIFCETEDEAHEQFIKFSKIHIDENGLGNEK